MSAEMKPRVLVVDDDEPIRIWLKGLLASLGCEVIGEADNGQDGIEMFRKHRPDLVLLDIRMPVMTGDKALDYILLEDPNAHVILLTSVRDSRFIFDRLDAGAQYYIRKDNPPEEIRALLQEQIQKIKTNPANPPG